MIPRTEISPSLEWERPSETLSSFVVNTVLGPRMLLTYSFYYWNNFPNISRNATSWNLGTAMRQIVKKIGIEILKPSWAPVWISSAANNSNTGKLITRGRNEELILLNFLSIWETVNYVPGVKELTVIRSKDTLIDPHQRCLRTAPGLRLMTKRADLRNSSTSLKGTTTATKH